MPKYKCKDCGAVFYGWRSKGICRKCGGKLELVPENSATKKKEAGPSQG